MLHPCTTFKPSRKIQKVISGSIVFVVIDGNDVQEFPVNVGWDLEMEEDISKLDPIRRKTLARKFVQSV